MGGFRAYLDDLHRMILHEQVHQAARQRTLRELIGSFLEADVPSASWSEVREWAAGRKMLTPGICRFLIEYHGLAARAASRTVALFEELLKKHPELCRELEQSKNLVDAYNVHDSHIQQARTQYAAHVLRQDVLKTEPDRALLDTALAALVSGGDVEVTVTVQGGHGTVRLGSPVAHRPVAAVS